MIYELSQFNSFDLYFHHPRHHKTYYILECLFFKQIVICQLGWENIFCIRIMKIKFRKKDEEFV